MKLGKLMLQLCLGGLFLTGCDSSSNDDGVDGFSGSMQVVYCAGVTPDGRYADESTAILTINNGTFILQASGGPSVVLSDRYETGPHEITWTDGTYVYAVSEVNGKLNEVNYGLDNGDGTYTGYGQFRESCNAPI